MPIFVLSVSAGVSFDDAFSLWASLKHLSHEEFECLNWLPVTYKFKQCVNSIVFKYFNEQGPNYLVEVFNVAPESNIQLRGSFPK